MVTPMTMFWEKMKKVTRKLNSFRSLRQTDGKVKAKKFKNMQTKLIINQILLNGKY